MFLCPNCGGEARAKHTDTQPDGSVKRRRRCLVCDHRFSTREVPHDYPIQGRDALGRFIPENGISVPDCKRCHHWWGGRCELNHPEPATCSSFLSHRRAASMEKAA